MDTFKVCIRWSILVVSNKVIAIIQKRVQIRKTCIRVFTKKTFIKSKKKFMTKKQKIMYNTFPRQKCWFECIDCFRCYVVALYRHCLPKVPRSVSAVRKSWYLPARLLNMAQTGSFF